MEGSKKKVWKRPGRHLLQNRVGQRERMNAQREEEENEKKVETKDDLERERIDKKGATSASAVISKIKEKDNQFFPVYKFID